jgi:hypothetical protein
MFLRLKKDKTRKAKRSKMLIVRWRFKEMLTRSLVRNGWAQNMIDVMENSKDSFPPKGCLNIGRQYESTNSIKDVPKLSFGSPILLGGCLDMWVDE